MGILLKPYLIYLRGTILFKHDHNQLWKLQASTATVVNSAVFVGLAESR